MVKQPNDDLPQTSQTKLWSDAELQRVTRVFEMLIRVDKRLKKGKSNERQKKLPRSRKAKHLNKYLLSR